jgi:hypothetical protein
MSAHYRAKHLTTFTGVRQCREFLSFEFQVFGFAQLLQAISKPAFLVILNEVKDLNVTCRTNEILRFAQNDNSLWR